MSFYRTYTFLLPNRFIISLSYTCCKDASQIRNEADDTKDKASRLRSEADRLSGDVDDAETRLEEYERQAEEDERLTKEVELFSLNGCNRAGPCIVSNKWP